MPAPQDETLDDWGTLLQEVEEAGPELAGVEPLREELRKAHARGVILRALRGSLHVAAVESTQRLRTVLAEGDDAARRLRDFIRAALGPRAKELRRYGIKPLRRPERRAS